MKNLDLSAYGVEAMHKQEMTTTDGGVAWVGYCVKAAGLLFAFAGGYDAISDFGEGFRDGYKPMLVQRK